MALALFTRHDEASHARYQQLKQLARSQRRVMLGAPGTVKQRTRRGTEYWVREYLREDARKDDEHIGTVADVASGRLKEVRAEIDLAKALISGSSVMRLFGYERVERRTAAVLAAIFNHGLFDAGLTLVGSHAYGILLNEAGITAGGYTTRDVDLARAEPLSIVLRADSDFGSILNASGLRFAPVPGLPSHRGSASFKLPGAEALRVDLLVPGTVLGHVLPIEELGAHGQAIPLLEFLVKDPITAVALAPNHVIPVKVPSPERFAVHKLYSSQSRKTDRDKIRKDLRQSAVLAAALEEDRPGALEDAFRALPAKGRPTARRGARAAAGLLESNARAREVLERIARR